MSADGQGDSVNLNSSANDATATSKTILQDDSSSLPKVDNEETTSSVNISLASNLDLQAAVDEETEPTLKPAEKEKALDIDSELDFELKWDDDNEANSDDLCKMDTDPVSNDELDETSNKVMEQKANKNYIAEKEVEDTTNYEQVADRKDDSKGEVLNTADKETYSTEHEDLVFKDDTNLKIDLNSKVVESDTNSLDEHLVYSDVEAPEVEAPEVEEKVLLDELDAHISDNNLNNVKLDIGVDTPEVLPKTGENTKSSLSQHDLVSTAMDVDNDIILLPVKKEEIPDAYETLSSNIEMETSTYEVNNEHGLANPDVMIEIPTEDFIEDFDDSEMSEGGEQFDEDILLNNDTTDIQNMVSDTNKDTPPSKDEYGISAEKSVSDKSDKSEDSSSDKTDDKNQSMATEVSHADIILEATHSGTKITTNDDVLIPIAEPKPTIDEPIPTTNDVTPTTKLILSTNDDKQPTVEPKPTTNDHVSPTAEQKLTTNEDVQPTDEPKPTTNDDLPFSTEPKLSTNDDIQPTVEPKPTTNDDVDPTAEQKPTTNDDVESAAEPKLSTNDKVPPITEAQLSTTNDVLSTVEPKSTRNNDALPTAEPSNDNVDPTVKPKPTSNNDVSPTAEPKPTTNNDLQPTVEPIPTTNNDVSSTDEPKPTTCNDVQLTDESKLDDNIQPTGVAVLGESSLDPIVVKKELDECQDIQQAESDPSTIETENVSPSADLIINTSILELQKTSKAHDSSKDLEKTLVTEAEEGSSSGNLETKEVPDDEDVSSSELLEPIKVAEAKVLDATIDLEKSDSALEAPSASKYLLRELSEDPNVTDSLGLLAESSSRVMDDDDEQEDEDEDDDFDQDDESNQMTTEHSEDSNAQQSETDAPQSMDMESPATDKEEFTFPAEVEDTMAVAEAQDDTVVEGTKDVDADDETELAVEALLISESPEEPTKDVSQEDVSDADKQAPEAVTGGESKLRQLLLKDKEPARETPMENKSPSKVKRLEITKQNHEINIVDLEESSSEDDIQEVDKQAEPEPEAEGVTSVNIPDEVEVMAASAGSMSTMRHGDGEVVISGVPKPPPHKPARLNTSEVSIKTAPAATEPIPLPESGAQSQDSPAALKYGLEVFSLDSDDDEKQTDPPPKKMTAIELDRVRQNVQCVNMYCTSDSTTPVLPCDVRCAAYYGVKRGKVCLTCALAVAERTQSLIEGVREFAPLLSLDMGQTREEFVEISDSDSEDEPEAAKEAESVLGKLGATLLEENLADIFNETWDKFKMEERLREAQDELSELVNKMEGECTEIDAMLTRGQQMTDKVRQDLYNTFAQERQELPPILIYDTLPYAWSGLEDGIFAHEPGKETRQSKRRLAAGAEPPAKRPAIPLGYSPLAGDAATAKTQPKPSSKTAEVPVPTDDDNGDISVVKLSAEAAPAGLPPPGAASRPALRAGAAVYAMRNAYGTWHKAKVLDVQPKGNNQFTVCKVKFEHKVKNPCKLLPARCLAYDQPSDVRMTIGTRVIALFKNPNNPKSESYYSGIIAEIPNPVNLYRYLVFFDDGYAQYVTHGATRLVCEFAKLVWDEVHPFSRQFVRDYLRAYPERPMVRVHAGQSLKTEWNGKWWVSRVVKVDASLVQVHFQEDDRYEWIYRGSTRLAPLYLELQAAERQRARPLPRAQPGRRSDMPYVEYTRSEEPTAVPASTPQQIEQEIRRQRAVARKSTALPPAPAPPPVASRVVYYMPKKSVRPLKMVTHECGPHCKRSGMPPLKDLRTYNPLAKPLLSGWDRLLIRYRWSKVVIYCAPCGRRIRDFPELHKFLQMVDSDLGVDLFDFDPYTNCLAEFVLTKCYNSKKDLSNGKERVAVPCVNYYDDSLPEFCLYSTQREPTTGVPLNLDPEFLCGCDCTDDCADKSKCACWKLTLEGARTIGFDGDEVGYVYKRLPEPLPSGIYECNSRCKCKQTCLNRVAQHPLQLKLQVFKTLNRGWGIRALNDVPRGGFICVYAGNLLTDATANLDGLIEGDEYLAELDYIEVVEQMKEGFEQDIPDADKRLDKDGGSTEFSESSSSADEEEAREHDYDDDDFRPAEKLAPSSVREYSKRLRKRDKKERQEKVKKESSDDNCITISDDEELREPARFAAQSGMGAAGFVSKYKSVRAHFGKDEACYIMDAKVQGNIGRYLNHSCTPNVFVQNVFVDTHDPRFPWVAFFALAHITSGTELTWNYNYDVGSVPGKVLYCHCGAPNCRGRLL